MFHGPPAPQIFMGYLLFAKPIGSGSWTYGKWFATHGEAQFWVHTIPVGSFTYKIMEINEQILAETKAETIQLKEDDDIPNEVVTPQCSLDEECESCQ